MGGEGVLDDRGGEQFTGEEGEVTGGAGWVRRGQEGEQGQETRRGEAD